MSVLTAITVSFALDDYFLLKRILHGHPLTYVHRPTLERPLCYSMVCIVNFICGRNLANNMKRPFFTVCFIVSIFRPCI
jgi:hypothetical protein